MAENGAVIAGGHNRRVQDGDPIAHGEMDCFRRAGRRPRYDGVTLYTTLSLANCAPNYKCGWKQTHRPYYTSHARCFLCYCHELVRLLPAANRDERFGEPGEFLLVNSGFREQAGELFSRKELN